MNFEDLNEEDLNEFEKDTINQIRAAFGAFGQNKSKGKVITKRLVGIPLGGGRPERDLCINGDDMINLTIAMNTCNTIDEFIAKI